MRNRKDTVLTEPCGGTALTAKTALDWLFRSHKSLPTISHIDHFYRVRESSGTEINAMTASVAYATYLRFIDTQSLGHGEFLSRLESIAL